MSESIKGITLDIGGDVTGLNKALKTLNTPISKVQSELKAIEAALKLDPTSTSLLAQKQELLAKSIDDTKNKLLALNNAKIKADSDMSKGINVNQEQYRKLQREIVFTENNLKKLQSSASSAAIGKSMDSATASTKKFDSSLESTSNKANKLSSSISSMVKAVVLGYTGKTLVQYLIGSNADMEQYQTSFEVLLGSADKAKTMMQDLTNFAANTPLELTDVTKQANQLLNYGVAAESIIPTLTKLGDLSSGNAAKLESVTRAYGQMTTNGKVSLEDLNQMTETGVPILQALADTAGVATSEMRQMITDGSVGMPELNKAIDSLATGSGKFSGMMEKQALTMNGMISTLKDYLAQAGRDVGQDAFEQLEVSAASLLSTLNEAKENGTYEAVVEEIGNAINNLVKGLISAAEFVYKYKDALLAAAAGTLAFKAALSITELITGVVTGIKILTTSLSAAKAAQEGATVAQIALNGAMIANPIGLVVAAVAALAAGLTVLALNADSTNKTIDEYNKAMEQVAQNSKDNISNSNAEISVIEQKANIYEDLRTKLHRTAEEETLLKQTAEDLQAVMPNGTQLINEQTGAYLALGLSIDDVIAKMKAHVLLENAETEFKAAVNAEESLREALENAQKKVQNTGGTKWGIGSILADNDLKKAQDALDDNLEIQENYKKQLKNYNAEVLKIEQKAADEQAKIRRKNLDQLEIAYNAGNYTYEEYVAEQNKIRGIEVGATKSAAKEIDASFKSAAELLKAKNSQGKLTDEQYYNDLETLLHKYTDNELGEYSSYFTEIYQGRNKSNASILSAQNKADKALVKETNKTTKELTDSWAKSTEKIVNDYSSKMDKIVSSRDDMQSKLESYGSIYSKETKTTTEGRVTSVDEVVDTSGLEDQVVKLKQWKKALEDLNAAGANTELLDAFKSLDVGDAIGYATNLLSKSDSEFQSYMALMQEKQDIINQTITGEYQGQIDKLKIEFTEAYTAQLQAMPPVTAAVGSDIIQGLIDGMDSKSGTLYATAKSMCDKLMQDIHDGTGCESPSKITKEVGKNIDKGLEIGIKENMPDVKNTMDKLMATVKDTSRLTVNSPTIFDTQLNATQKKSTGSDTEKVSKADNSGTVNIYPQYASPRPISRAASRKHDQQLMQLARLGYRR